MVATFLFKTICFFYIFAIIYLDSPTMWLTTYYIHLLLLQLHYNFQEAQWPTSQRVYPQPGLACPKVTIDLDGWMDKCFIHLLPKLQTRVQRLSLLK